jgi:molybdenum cofactor cytidylyltransferase
MRKIFGIVLAAGCASRFGSTKQLAEIDGAPLVKKAYDVAAQTFGGNTALVTGHEWSAVRDACQLSQGFLLFNSDYADGIGTSIAQAVRAVQHTADAVVILLADQVLVTTQHIRDLLASWDGSRHQIVATKYAGTVGAPTLFPAGCFADLGALAGDSGGRQLLHDKRFQLKTVVFEAAVADIDTPEDLKQI